MARTVSIFSSVLMAAWSLGSSTANAQQAEITPQPASIEVQVDDVFEVIMHIDPAGQPLAVADLHLQFNPSYLEVLEVEALGADGYNVLPAIIDNNLGGLGINAFQLGDESVMPAFDLVKIKMRALAETPGTLVNHPQDVFPRTILAFAGSELNTSITPLEVIITGSEVLSTITQAMDGLTLGVWPNPTSGTSFAEFGVLKGGHATLELFDVSGHAVMRVFHGSTAPGTNQRMELDMGALANGMYLLRLVTEQGTLVQRIALSK